MTGTVGETELMIAAEQRQADLAEARARRAGLDQARREVDPEYRRVQTIRGIQDEDYDLSQREPGRAAVRRKIGTADALETLYKVLRPTRELGLEMRGREGTQEIGQREADALSETTNQSRTRLGDVKHQRKLEELDAASSWRLPVAEMAAQAKAGGNAGISSAIDEQVARAQALSRVLNTKRGPAALLRGWTGQAEGEMNLNDAQREYDRIRGSLGVLLATRYQGSRPTDRDAQVFENLVPKPTDSEAVATQLWDNLKTMNRQAGRAGTTAAEPAQETDEAPRVGSIHLVNGKRYRVVSITGDQAELEEVP